MFTKEYLFNYLSILKKMHNYFKYVIIIFLEIINTVRCPILTFILCPNIYAFLNLISEIFSQDYQQRT